MAAFKPVLRMKAAKEGRRFVGHFTEPIDTKIHAFLRNFTLKYRFPCWKERRLLSQ